MPAETPTTSFHVDDKVRMTHDFGTSLAVPLGTEGVVAAVSDLSPHVVVDFGHPWCERGCRGGEYLEKVNRV